MTTEQVAVQFSQSRKMRQGNQAEIVEKKEIGRKETAQNKQKKKKQSIQETA